MLLRIISGGQTGADQGALDAALEVGFPCGGWCPKGRKSEAGKIPEKYPVTEMSSGGYPKRTEENIKDSDGTLIFSYGKPTGGTKLTVDLTKKHGKPYMIVDLLENPPFNERILDLSQVPSSQMPKTISSWIQDNEVQTLNAAGPRESKHPGTQFLVKTFVGWIIEFA